MDESTVRERFKIACEALQLYDRLLLEYDVGERTIAAKLLQYLVGVFPSHDVDFEYNRRGVLPKRVGWAAECTDNAESLVYPDLIIHRRGDDAANLVVCEVKKSSATPAQLDRDRLKLRAIKEDFHYQHALLVVVPTGVGTSGEIAVESVG
jgi:hypothetical protein